MPQAIFERINCDKKYGGSFDDTGPQCRRCEAGQVFRKNIQEARLVWPRIRYVFGVDLHFYSSTDAEEVTLVNEEAFQRCVKCPEFALSCDASSIRMEPGQGQGLQAIRWDFVAV